ncbi:hypothetical protein ABCY62_20355 [Acetivibrio clariflavus]|uniref:hypothetical protein n=1 Tax=Acetivibrio clariflavus TaxID=288965 RepID=UPI0031F4E3F1
MSEKYVWYACYGSNILKERFMHYIKGGECRFNGAHYNGCKDKSDPLDERPFAIPHKLYFGKKSHKWENGGVAFLDPERNDSMMTLGKIYKITYDQFMDIQKQEGESWYDKILCLGEVDGIPVKTFTHSFVVYERKPCVKYINVIRLGLKETYPEMSDEEIEQYIKRHIMP